MRSRGLTPMLHKFSVGTAAACSRSPNLTPCSENLDSTYGVRTPRPDFPARAATFGLLEHSDSKVYATLGFTLIETLIAMMIMAGGIIMIANAWSGNTQRLLKSRVNNTIAILLQRKMTEIEVAHQDKTLEEIKEEDSGDFGAEYPEFKWTMSSKEFEIPDMTSALVTREGGADEMLMQVLRQMSEYIKQVVKEVTVSVLYQGKFAKHEIKNSVTTYMVDYKKEVAIGPSGVGGAGAAGGTGAGGPTTGGK